MSRLFVLLLASLRITSYNVCYTKLLREFATVAVPVGQDGLGLGATGVLGVLLDQGLEQYLVRGVTVVRLAAVLLVRGQYGFQADLGRVATLGEAGVLIQNVGNTTGHAVITSYSIHYTKLYEDYTYHLEPGNNLVLGAHMLEVCPSIASHRPVLDVQHP